LRRRRRAPAAPGLPRVSDPDLHHPAVAVGILVDELGVVGEPLVDFDELSRERRVDVRHRLDRLDLGVGLILGELRADRGSIEVDDVAERVLRVPGDAEGRDIALDPRPVVLGWYSSSGG